MKKIIALTVAVLLAAPAGALEWINLGPRAVGMGGAGVALAQGPLASYWNPGALGRPTENAYGLQIPVTVHYGITGSVVEGAKDLQHVFNACPGGADCTDANVQNALNELNQPGNGVRVDAGVGGDFKVGRLAFFANGFLDVGAIPQIDTVHNTKATVSQNTSALIMKGARIAEFGVGYGHELFVPGLYLGGDVKLMNAQVGYSRFVIITNNGVNNSNIVSTFRNSTRTSDNFGVDAGLLWDIQQTYEGAWLHPRFGLVGRNLNNPKFSQPSTAAADGVNGRFAVNPQARAGIAISPLHWWNIAIDADLTRNLTPVDNVASRQIGLGTEINVFNRSWINIPLRAGLSRNTAETGSGTMLSLGAGFNFLHCIIDLSGSVSPKRIQTQSQGSSTKIPREATAALQLSFLFGGSEASQAPEFSTSTKAPTPPPAPAQTLSPAAADAVRANAAQAQKDLNTEAEKH